MKNLKWSLVTSILGLFQWSIQSENIHAKSIVKVKISDSTFKL
jgi:hypothetical protein